MSHLVKAITAGIASADGGGFRAIASTPALDRDGEVLAAHCFDPLPATIAVHLDHTMSAATVIGRAVPYYVGNDLHIDCTLASTLDAQTVRTKLAEGVLDSISVVFIAQQWEQRAGVRTCVKAELLAADVVSVPSQSAARVLSVRNYPATPAAEMAQVRRARPRRDEKGIDAARPRRGAAVHRRARRARAAWPYAHPGRDVPARPAMTATSPPADSSQGSNTSFAQRRAARLAREGQAVPPKRRRTTLRAGVDADNNVTFIDSRSSS